MSLKLTDLTEAYRSLLSTMGVVVDNSSVLSQDIDDVRQTVMVNGKPVVLPTTDTVNNYTDGMVMFHPLCENVLLGESPVLQELRSLSMDYLNYMVTKVIDAMLAISLDTTITDDMSPRQIELMRATAGSDATTLKNWRSIARRIEPRESRKRVLTVYLKRGAELDGTTYKRVAIVNFDIYNQLEEGTLTIYGSKIRKNDAKIYSKLLESIFPRLESADEYSAGSNSLIAPYFDALIKAHFNVLTALNSVTWLLRKPIEKAVDLKLHVPLDYMERLSNLIEYRDVLPTMPLNDGDRQTRREVEPAPAPPTTTGGFPTAAETAHRHSLAEQAQGSSFNLPPEPVTSVQFNTPPPTVGGMASYPTLEQQLAGNYRTPDPWAAQQAAAYHQQLAQYQQAMQHHQPTTMWGQSPSSTWGAPQYNAPQGFGGFPNPVNDNPYARNFG